VIEPSKGVQLEQRREVVDQLGDALGSFRRSESTESSAAQATGELKRLVQDRFRIR
jgi:hypothetical protein